MLIHEQTKKLGYFQSKKTQEIFDNYLNKLSVERSNIFNLTKDINFSDIYVAKWFNKLFTALLDKKYIIISGEIINIEPGNFDSTDPKPPK